MKQLARHTPQGAFLTTHLVSSCIALLGTLGSSPYMLQGPAQVASEVAARAGAQDLEACVWLEETLKKYRRILLMVSHSQARAPERRRPSNAPACAGISTC